MGLFQNNEYFYYDSIKILEKTLGLFLDIDEDEVWGMAREYREIPNFSAIYNGYVAWILDDNLHYFCVEEPNIQDNIDGCFSDVIELTNPHNHGELSIDTQSGITKKDIIDFFAGNYQDFIVERVSEYCEENSKDPDLIPDEEDLVKFLENDDAFCKIAEKTLEKFKEEFTTHQSIEKEVRFKILGEEIDNYLSNSRDLKDFLKIDEPKRGRGR